MTWYQGQTLQQWAGGAKILALAFTDIVDSTVLGRRVGDKQYLEIVRRHIQTGRMFIQQNHGYEIKIIGDSFMVAFHSAVEALNFALDFYRNTGDVQVKIRAGVHVGPVYINENDLIGLMVNYTKRVESAAQSGGIAISNEAKIHHIDSERDPRHVGLPFHQQTVPFKGYDTPQTVWLTQ